MKANLSIIAFALVFSISLNAQVGIGTNSPDASAILHLSSTEKGFLPPVLTTSNRANITSPAAGLLFYNSTDSKLNLYNGSWNAIPLSTSGAAGITLGSGSGASGQSINGIAIGANAGVTNQGLSSIAVGTYAGSLNQNSSSVAIGNNAGSNNQAQNSTAIGYYAGYEHQGLQSLAVGYAAGYMNQGNSSIAIGALAGTFNQSVNSIAINASGVDLNPGASGFYVAPIRSTASSYSSVVYDPTSKEIFYTASDARLKNNIQPLTSGLEEVMRLQPVSFSYRESVESNNYDGHNIGFIAQQVKEVIPEAVTTNPDSLLAINTTTLIPVLVKAIQELKEENKVLSAKIDQLQKTSKTHKSGIFSRKKRYKPY